MIRLARAGAKDVSVLAEMNRQMTEDEGYRGPLSLPRLKTRMREWLRSGKYVAVFFLDEDDSKVGYAIFQREEDSMFFAKRQVFLRHFFVARGRRRRGIGKQALKALRDEFWGGASRVHLHVLTKNRNGIGFWHGLGFKEYQLGMELKVGS